VEGMPAQSTHPGAAAGVKTDAAWFGRFGGERRACLGQGGSDVYQALVIEMHCQTHGQHCHKEVVKKEITPRLVTRLCRSRIEAKTFN